MIRHGAYKIIALILLIPSVVLFLILYIPVVVTSSGSFFFRQKRTGKNGKSFTMYKIRTMKSDAEDIKHALLKKNQADGPVFKIYNDPRFTKIGRIIAKYGIDELPQLLNIIKGEMSFVGPRPLPVEEANKIPQKYHIRESVLPGITSLWVANGSHSKLNFTQWMESDLEYLKQNSFFTDIKIIILTIKRLCS